MEKNKRGRGVERGERSRRIDFSLPPSAENQESSNIRWAGWRKSQMPANVAVSRCYARWCAYRRMQASGRCLRVAYPGYIIRQRQSPAIQLGCPSLVLVHAPSIRSMMYHLLHTYRIKSLWRSNPASERLGEGTKSQGSRWHAARQKLPIGRATDAVTASMSKTARN
ncbi:uncharacterized protein TrAtP1_003475 [Trichoderma atroviride]|uniref:uncharacterized protein n=1 Tax=Hypocrea atroviridis TaxID=63577 RepID=UPI003331E9AD|nr:hypothetical protein TrAtP1_003475 [Trichoderma atroviride]